MKGGVPGVIFDRQVEFILMGTMPVPVAVLTQAPGQSLRFSADFPLHNVVSQRFFATAQKRAAHFRLPPLLE